MEATHDAAFFTWLKQYNPAWEEKTGDDLVQLYDAWCAGMPAAEDEFATRDIPSEDN